VTRASTWSVVESERGWLVDPLNAEIWQIRVDYAFTLIMDEFISLRIESEFDYFDGEKVIRINPEITADQAPLLTLHYVIVTRLDLTRAGVLTVHFADGRSILVKPNSQFESFSLGIRGTGLFIGSVGGEVSYFASDA